MALTELILAWVDFAPKVVRLHIHSCNLGLKGGPIDCRHILALHHCLFVVCLLVHVH